MTNRVSDREAVVVGAGAAGIAAARELTRLGACVRVLEARARPGGRAHTALAGGWPVDLGCGWLHSADRNPLVDVARGLGLTIDTTLPPWKDVRAGMSFQGGEEPAFRQAQAAFYDRLEEAVERGGDPPAADLLAPGERWNPLIDAVSTYVNGVELAGLSARDYCAYQDSEVNWRVAEGYGALFARLAASLPASLSASLSVAFGRRVTRIDHAGRRLRIETDAGTIEADAVVIAVPTDVVARGGLVLSPGLPGHLDACARLPLGANNKLFLSVEGAGELPENGRLFGDYTRTRTGAYHYRPFGRPMIEGFFGGALARDLEAGGLAAFADFAIEELVGALGSSWRGRLKPLCASAWSSDPFSMGSYSHALPGHADARARLAESAEERIAFAGEAVSPHQFSTAHGAWESGIAAARALAGVTAALRGPDEA